MITVEQVRGALGLDPYDTADDEWLQQVTDAANAWIPTVRPDLTLKPADPDAGDWVI